jgi:radical SAM superfamily enzyme YgiQ (UPF0313 family)
MNNFDSNSDRILLVLLPFWTPLIPPLGIACLQAHLRWQGFRVNAVDANVIDEFKQCYDIYFSVLKECVPEEKQGNFYSIGHDVLRNHLMARLHREENTVSQYYRLVRHLVEQTYFFPMTENQVQRLSEPVETFYHRLETFFLHLLEETEPGILGISVYSDTLPASLFVFQLAKQRFPHIKTIMGGGIFADQFAVGSQNLEVFLERTDHYIDKIFIGEGEILFLKWLYGELPQSQRVYTGKDIHGETLDLSTALLPDFSSFNLDFYPYLGSYISRSCPYQCGFCAETLNWGKYRKKSIPQAVDELTRLTQSYGIRSVLLGDSLLNPVISPLAQEIIQTGLSIYWDGYLRVEESACNLEKTLLWRRGGFYRARLGIESGSQTILDAMGKKITIEQIKQTVSALAYAGIKTTTYWIMGYPGETAEDFLQTLYLVEELKHCLYEAECKPFYYHPQGQVNSYNWFRQYRQIPVYESGEIANRMLMLSTWKLDCEPGREETYRRVSRFIKHCQDLDVPNPYSLNEIYHADERWKKLHKNAVPSLVELKEKDSHLLDTGNVKNMNFARNQLLEDDGFDF